MAVSIRENFIVRAPTMDDVKIAVDFINLCSNIEGSPADANVEDKTTQWKTPGFNLETDARLVFGPSGDLAGMIQVWDVNPLHVRPNMWGRVHPDFQGQGLGTMLLEFGENRVQQCVATAPPDARVAVNMWVNAKNEHAQQFYLAHGYKLVRTVYDMAIELTEAPPEPQWPEGITLRTMIPGQDDRPVHDALEEAFSDHWGHLPMPFELYMHYLYNSKEFDPTLAFMAMDGDEIAGLSLCIKETLDGEVWGWVDDLGVRRPWRKRGLGLALLRHSFGEFYRRGLPKIGLGVDATNLTGALRLYERAGMHVAQQFRAYQKELRPGNELTTETLSD
jgi:mycothiol synthase